jgi:hypothetical protein
LNSGLRGITDLNNGLAIESYNTLSGEQMNKNISIAIALLLMTAAIPAQAAGCIKGAVVGGVAGHFAHHHAVLGAVAGCAIGHHAAIEKKRALERQKEQQQAAHGTQGNY